MAKSNAVWGIDIGQCALKALRCAPHDDEDKIEVLAFDYIEYPKILSQAEADPDELIQDALRTFLSRNEVQGDKIAISVSGQNGLSRFIKLPPVEKKKIPDIVKYEARQQIPFALEDVIWDYQEMGGGSEEEGFALETEVGLFAMKRDQVFESLRPFEEAGIDVDIIQLTPLALYNYIVFDQMRDIPSPEDYDPENPPPSVIVISIGTDTTDLVVTNGYKVWQRSVPLGGNHFTKALTKQLKLTFSKAEHLKRNAEQAEDPRVVYQAMRPVFSDLVAELMRSINFFYSLEKDAKITRAITLGNAMKLPGLESYLAKNLKDASKNAEIEVTHVESFPGLVGPAVLTAPSFKENQLSFGVCYGLALQGTGRSRLKTNLIPTELLTDRMIRAKKPWAVAAVTLLMLGCCVNFVGAWLGLYSVRKEKYSGEIRAAETVEKESKRLIAEKETKMAELTRIKQIGSRLAATRANRLRWAEMIAALGDSLPREADAAAKWQKEIGMRTEICVKKFDCQWVEDLAAWYALAKEADIGNSVTEADTGPTGSGWVIFVKGYHFYNEISATQSTVFVANTLVADLKKVMTGIPVPGNPDPVSIDVRDLGISYPIQMGTVTVHKPDTLTNPNDSEDKVNVKRFDFDVQFAWQPNTPGRERDQVIQERTERERLERERKAAENSITGE